MVAAFYKKVRTDDEYNKIRAKFGDTTSVEAQLAALRSLGLQAEFRKDGNAEMVELEIENGRPVMWVICQQATSWLREPPMCNGLGCGHWAIISGYSQKQLMTLFGYFKTLAAIQKWKRADGLTRI